MRDDVGHLGIVIGDQERPRVVALGTSAVFRDTSLCRTFWNTDASDLDLGLQAHLYTRTDDILVVQVPAGAVEPRRRLAAALDANCRIWSRLAGVDLASSGSRVVLTTGPGRHVRALEDDGPPRMTWFPGSMLDAVAAVAAAEDVAVLAFVCDEELLSRLGIDGAVDKELTHRGQIVSALMDKGEAMSLLLSHAVPSALSHTFHARDGDDAVAIALEAGLRYVFKPTGGAAGVGVFTNEGQGADATALVRHVRRLREQGRLPGRFQVQEFLNGPVMGASVLLDGRGDCRVLEVHQQLIDPTSRFVGARWTKAGHASLQKEVADMGRTLSTVLDVSLLIGLDMVDGRVIEVNPRVTASAPIAHLLRRAGEMTPSLGTAEVERIDVDTRVPISWDSIASGRAEAAAQTVQGRFGTLVLPQGLNPFGGTRVVFVNDDENRSARSAFMSLIT